jgi:hypothetical protein
MKAWTDYPIAQLGDEYGKKAPIRECYVYSYDGDKYCEIIVEGVHELVKSGYLYSKPGRVTDKGIPQLTRRQLAKLPPTIYLKR